jgi:ATP-dependent Clp protease ATP-binding subunit ClpX
LNNSGGSGKDVGGKAVQDQLLTVIEGCKVPMLVKGGPPRDLPESFNTDGLLVVLAGAFVGLDAIRAKRLAGGRQSIGFGGGHVELAGGDARYTAQDLIEFGLTPEFVGRISVVAETQPLAIQDLVDALQLKDSGPLHQHARLLAEAGIKLSWSLDACKAIAQAAQKKGSGARGLRSEVEELLRPLLVEGAKGPVRMELGADDKVVLRHARKEKEWAVQAAMLPQLGLN